MKTRLEAEFRVEEVARIGCSRVNEESAEGRGFGNEEWIGWW